jgi:hypothetical protein
MKQISEINERIERLEKVLEEKSWNSWLHLHRFFNNQGENLILSMCSVLYVL